MKKLTAYSLLILASVTISLSTISCIYDPTDPFYYDNIFQKELEFCKKFLNRYFLFRDALPVNDSIFATPKSLFASVNEPYTEYLVSDTAETFRSKLKATFVSNGHGIEFDSVGNGVVVTYLYPESPAQKSPLECGDTIIVINNDTLAGLKMVTVNFYLGAIASNKKVIQIKRDTLLVDSFSLGDYTIPSVYIDSVDTNIAYIYIAAFLDETGGTVSGVDAALITTQWADTIIVDVRDNYGGDFDQCLLAASRFLPLGSQIIKTTEWDVDSLKETIWVAAGLTTNDAKTYFLLINDSTAAAAEIFVSCFKENNVAAKITGLTTFGFGYKQIFTTTPDSGIAKVTKGQIISISGDSLHENGIIPTDPVLTTKDALEKVLEDIGGGIMLYQEVFDRISFLQKKYKIRNRTIPLCYTWEK